ncbi:MAG: hypothetical protein WBM71_19295, partial [Sedimenticolaceae bacterium]
LTMIDARQFDGAARHLELSLGFREDAVERARLAWVHWNLGAPDKARRDLDMAMQMEEEIDPYVDWVRGQLDEPAAVPQPDG